MTPATLPQRPTARDRALKLLVVLERAVGAVNEKLRRSLVRFELTDTEFGILEALLHKGPLLLGDLQKKILLTSGGVTYTVDRLVEKGLVERRECPTDKRARYAALTPKGEALIARVFPQHAADVEKTMAALSAREQDEVIALLRKLGLSAEE